MTVLEDHFYVADMTTTQAGTTGEVNHARRTHRLLTTGVAIATIIAIIALLLHSCSGAGAKSADGASAYDIWLQLGNQGSEQNFIDSLRGAAGPQVPAGADGATGATGATGPAGPPGPLGLGDSGSFWDETTQGDANVNPGFLADTPYVMTFDHADTVNNRGVSIVGGSEITFTTAGVYNLAFSAQMERSQGGAVDNVTIWLRVNGVDIPWTSTDFTMVANSTRVVAAWNFHVPPAPQVCAITTRWCGRPRASTPA